MKYIFHVDANSAFLSWTAVKLLDEGHPVDLRTVPSVVGGSEKKRAGIVLAASVPAKRLGIHTAETLVSARKKCRNLIQVPADPDLYRAASNAMVEILTTYTPKLKRASIDECYLEIVTDGQKEKDPLVIANTIRMQIYEELGFTVNVGISVNLILAKMAGELEKPNKVMTIFHDEVEEKLHPLPVEALYGVGMANGPKLRAMGINTIGDLSRVDPDKLWHTVKGYAHMYHEYANGRSSADISLVESTIDKSVGNGVTAVYNVDNREEAYMHLHAVAENIGMRLRSQKMQTSLISVSVRQPIEDEVSGKKDRPFRTVRRQRQLQIFTDSTTMISRIACELFDEVWNGRPIRKLSVRAGALESASMTQLTYMEDMNKEMAIDEQVDTIRGKYGKFAIFKGAAYLDTDSRIKPVMGGSGAENYPVMTSSL